MATDTSSRPTAPLTTASNIFHSAISYLNASAIVASNAITSTMNGTQINTVFKKRVLSGKQYIIWKNIQSVQYNNNTYRYLCIGLHDGFQLYSIYDECDVRLICGYTELNNPCSYAQIKLLPHMTSTINCTSSQQRDLLIQQSQQYCTGCMHNALLLVTTANERTSFKRNEVRIFSVNEKKFIHTLSFKSRVHSIDVNNNAVAISLENEIHLYRNPISKCTGINDTKPDQLQFQLINILPCYTNAKNCSSLALGTRWVAYSSIDSISLQSAILSTNLHSPRLSPVFTSNKSPPLLSSSPAPQPLSHTNNTTLPVNSLSALPPNLEYQSIGSVAKNVASTLYNLGGYSKQKVTEYINSDKLHSNSLHSSHNTNHTNAGTITIRDIVTSKVICTFRQFNVPVTSMTWDTTGTLLAVVPADGQYVHIYKISGVCDSNSNSNIKCLYRLFRGISHATIRSIAFSSDSKWITMSSTNGTTHIYAINPNGGQVTYYTHSAVSQPNNQQKYTNIQSIDNECYTINPRYRIKHASSGEYNTEQQSSNNDSNMVSKYVPTYTPIINGWISNKHNAVDSLIIMSELDELTTHKLDPIPSLPSQTTVNAHHAAASMMNGLLHNTNNSASNSPKHINGIQNKSNIPTIDSHTKLALTTKLLASYDLSEANNSKLLQYTSNNINNSITMTSTYFIDLLQSRYVVNTMFKQSVPVKQQLQHAYWLSQSELYTTPSTLYVPVYASPIFTLYTYADNTDTHQIQNIGNHNVVPLKYDKYSNTSDSAGIISDKLADAMTSSVSTSRTTDTELMYSPGSSSFSPQSIVLDRDLLNEDTLNLSATQDMLSASINNLAFNNQHFATAQS